MKKRSVFGQKLSALAAAVLIAGTMVFQPGGLALAEEEELLIEDDGEEISVQSGERLEDLQKAEQQEASEQAAREMEALQGDLVEGAELQLEPASSQRLEEYLEGLCQMESPTGSDGELIIGRYIEEVMEGFGYTTSLQSFHEGFLNKDHVDVPGINIMAERGADAQERHSDILIVASHYDSKTDPQEGDALANDKSGAAVLLELARILAYEDTDTDICFLFLSGEEDGLYGSVRFIESMEENLKSRVTGVLYVEKVGLGDEWEYKLKTLDGEENYLGNLVRERAVTAENPDFWNYEADTMTSQKSFAEAGFTSVTVCQDIRGQEEGQTEGMDSEEQTGGLDYGEQTEDAVQEQQDKTFALGEENSQAAAQNLMPEVSGEDAAQEAGVTASDPETEQGIILTGDTIAPDLDALCEITDILAEAIGYIMNENTGSFLY